MSFTLMAAPFAGLDYRVLDVLHAAVETESLHVDLLGTLFDEAPAAIRIVVGDLLLDLANRKSVRDKLFGIKLDLVLLGRSAEA